MFEVVDELDPVVEVEDDVGSVVDVVVEVVSSDCEAGAEVEVVVELVVLELVLDVVELEEVEPVVDVVPLVDVVEPELAEVVEVVEQDSVVDELDPVVDVRFGVVDVVELDDEGEVELVVVVVSVDCVSAMSFSWWWRDEPKGIARTSAVSPMVTEALMCQVLICLIGHRLAGLFRAKKVASFADLSSVVDHRF